MLHDNNFSDCVFVYGDVTFPKFVCSFKGFKCRADCKGEAAPRKVSVIQPFVSDLHSPTLSAVPTCRSQEQGWREEAKLMTWLYLIKSA